MHNNNNEKTKTASALVPGAHLILFGAQLAIGSAAIFARYALQGAGPLMVSAMRLTIASVITLILFFRLKDRIAVSKQHELLFAVCGLALSVHFGTWMASLNFTSVAIATLFVSTAPIWTALYDVLVLKQKPPVLFWLGFIAAAIGSILIVTNNGVDTVSGSVMHNDLLGEILSATGGLAFACYLIAIRSVSDTYPTLVVVSRTYTWSAVALWVGALAMHEGLPAADGKCWFGILGMSLVSQMLGHTGMNVSLKNFTSSVVALSTLLEPVFAAILAVPMFGETLSFQMIAGSVVLL
ncbi:MAG TPA: EamA family transporter, partial [Chroococcales cyanobacterium]